MPIYTYRREDGTTFDLRQKFLDEPLMTCPTTGQAVARVIQPAGIIFKGSGFYVNDNSKNSGPASKSAAESDSAPSTAKTDAKPKKDAPAKKSKPAAALK